MWLVSDSFQCYLTIKFPNVKGMCVSSCRFATSLGPWLKVQSHDVESGQCRGGVRPLLPTGTVWGGGDGRFCGLGVRGDGRRSSRCKRETRHQLLTCLHRDLQQNHDTVDRVTGGRKWGNIHRWVWWEIHSNWHGNPTDVGNRSLQRHGMILTFTPLWVERHKCDNALQQFDFWSSWCFELSKASFSFPRGMFSEVDVKFASSLHALCSRYVDPPELLHLADSSPMHERNVALVVAMNTPTAFCNVNYMQKKRLLNIMTPEFSINKIQSAVI